jgi:type II secretory pathway component PulK
VNARRFDERGFALVAVLWVITGIAGLVLLYRLAAREAVDAATNRVELSAARWRAEECIARARAAVAEALRAAQSEGPTSPTWSSLDVRVVRSALTTGCDLEMRPASTGIDPNTVDTQMITRLLVGAGIDLAAADSMADALVDWRDVDSVARPRGAEAAWYRRTGQLPPRNAPLADVRELRLIRGFDREGLDTLFSLEPGRVDLNHAPAAVLGALPGFTPEAVARITELRARGARLDDLLELDGILSSAARAMLRASYAEVDMLATTIPEAWVIVARSSEGSPPGTAAVEIRIGRATGRAAVVRKRTWIE